MRIYYVGDLPQKPRHPCRDHPSHDLNQSVLRFISNGTSHISTRSGMELPTTVKFPFQLSHGALPQPPGHQGWVESPRTRQQAPTRPAGSCSTRALADGVPGPALSGECRDGQPDPALWVIVSLFSPNTADLPWERPKGRS